MVHGLQGGAAMDNSKDLIARELESLQQTRDELRVKVHLASAEAKTAWDEVERKWLALEDKAKQIASTTETTAGNVTEAARMLVEEIKQGYRRFVETAG
jgi:SMC interacting uncharacterized protein involved in chromosome segregation